MHGTPLCRSIDVRAYSPSPQSVLDKFLAASDRRVPVPYRAVRRLEAALVDGTILVTADGDWVRVQGRLAKSPSFWTRSVDLVRHYARRAGRPVPVEVQSLADVNGGGVRCPAGTTKRGG